MGIYKVKVNTAIYNESIQKNGYLAVFGKVQKYNRGEAIHKAQLFNGKIEKVISKREKKDNHTIIIEVLGGVAEVTKCPKNIIVTIIDHDNESAG